MHRKTPMLVEAQRASGTKRAECTAQGERARERNEWLPTVSFAVGADLVVRPFYEFAQKCSMLLIESLVVPCEDHGDGQETERRRRERRGTGAS
jgi:hypothetical protein